MKQLAAVTIEGVKPLLINSFPIDTLSRSKSKSGITGEDNIEWKRTVLMTHERELYVHSSYLIGSIVGGGKNIKIGKATLSKKIGGTLDILEAILKLGVFVPPDDKIAFQPPLDESTPTAYVDVRSVVNPMTKGRNVRYRVAVSPGWKLSGTLSWDDRVISSDDVKNCVEFGGLFEGIGDGRRIGFGRFKVIDFQKK